MLAMRRILYSFLFLPVSFTAIGCQPEKELNDIETPAGGVEVRENEQTGEVTIDVDEQP